MRKEAIRTIKAEIKRIKDKDKILTEEVIEEAGKLFIIWLEEQTLKTKLEILEMLRTGELKL